MRTTISLMDRTFANRLRSLDVGVGEEELEKNEEGRAAGPTVSIAKSVRPDQLLLCKGEGTRTTFDHEDAFAEETHRLLAEIGGSLPAKGRTMFILHRPHTGEAPGVPTSGEISAPLQGSASGTEARDSSPQRVCPDPDGASPPPLQQDRDATYLVRFVPFRTEALKGTGWWAEARCEHNARHAGQEPDFLRPVRKSGEVARERENLTHAIEH